MEEKTAVRVNSELKIPHDTFQVKIGTTNRLNPRVIYWEAKTFISPIYEKDDYDKDIRDIKRFLSKLVSDAIANSEYFDKRYIIDFRLANSGIKVNKNSFLSFEFLLKQIKEEPLKLKEINEIYEEIVVQLLNQLTSFIEGKDFTVSKKKTKKHKTTEDIETTICTMKTL